MLGSDNGRCGAYNVPDLAAEFFHSWAAQKSERLGKERFDHPLGRSFPPCLVDRHISLV